MSAIQLSNINISEISLVKAGANGLEFIAKSGGHYRVVTITKADKVKKVVYGVVYEPDVLDSQGEKATAEEIEKACWSAMKNNAVVKTDHKDPAAAYLCESFIAKTGDPDGFKKGAWIAGVKIEDDALWADVEKGIYKAFSMGGEAAKTPVEKKDPAQFLKSLEGKPIEQIVEAVRKEIYADSMVYASNFKDALTLLQAIATTLGEVVTKVSGNDAAVKKSVDALPAQLAELSKKVEAGNALITKIADSITDGRASTDTPGVGGPAIDPSKY